MSKPIVVIDPGHGGSDPGAVGYGLKEKDLALQISLYQRDRLQELGISAAMTRDMDIQLVPEHRANIIKQLGARYCLCNHLNAYDGTVQGVECAHSIHANGQLANAVYKEIVAAGQVGRRVFTRILPNLPRRDYYYVHRETGPTEVLLIEYGFIDHAEDSARLSANWRAYAEAAIKGLCLHAKLPYQVPKALELPAVDQREEAIYLLQKAGVINSPDYWIINAKRGQVVSGEYAAGLISNMAKFIERR